MKITIEQEGNRCIVETDDVCAGDVLQCCLHAMLGVGFHPESVKEAVLEKAEEIQTETYTETNKCNEVGVEKTS